MSDLVKLRRGTAAQWAAANPILAAGEPGYESDTKVFKLGDGSTNWTGLPRSNPQESVAAVSTSGAAQTIPDPGINAISRIVLSANCTLTFPTAAAGKSFTLVLVQDATGSRTVTWPGTVQWAGGTAPTLTTTANKSDVFSFLCADGTNWLGFVGGLAF